MSRAERNARNMVNGCWKGYLPISLSVLARDSVLLILEKCVASIWVAPPLKFGRRCLSNLNQKQ